MLGRREFIEGAGLAAGSSLLPVLAFGAATPATNPPGQSATSPDLLYPDKATRAPPPGNGAASNHNYFIYGGGQPILGLAVTMEVTEDVVAPSGMGLQLNAYSPANANCVWQQYVTGFTPKESPVFMIGWSIENWPSKEFRAHLHETIGLADKGDLLAVLSRDVMGHNPTFGGPSDRIPAGFKIRYELTTDPNDQSGAIDGAIFTFSERGGKRVTSGPQLLRSLKFTKTKTPVGPAALAPVLALQFNMVGVSGGRFMQMQSGAGTITYEAKTMLTAEGKQPSTTAAHGVFTAETSNIASAELGTTPSQKIVQKFRAVAGVK